MTMTALTTMALALPLALVVAQDDGAGSKATGLTRTETAAFLESTPKELPRFEVITLEYSVAADLADVLSSLLSPANKVMVDKRTNSLLVMAADVDAMDSILRIVAALDVPVGGAPEQRSASEAPKVDELFPKVSGDLEIKAEGDDGGTTLLDLMAAYSKLTGQNITIGVETRQILGSSHTGLLRSTTIAANQVQSFVEHLLAANDCVLEPIKISEPRLVGVTSLRAKSRNVFRSNAIHIDVADIAIAAQHPAVLWTTSVELQNVDVRHLSNSMRMMLTDAGTQQMIPAGNSDSMILTALGSNLANLVKTLQLVDERSKQ